MDIASDAMSFGIAEEGWFDDLCLTINSHLWGTIEFIYLRVSGQVNGEEAGVSFELILDLDVDYVSSLWDLDETVETLVISFYILSIVEFIVCEFAFAIRVDLCEEVFDRGIP